MVLSIEDHIKDLLFVQDCVIIPEFGGLVSNQIPSKINTISGTIVPPSKLIVFNKNLNINDGLLINYISNKENIPVEESKKIVIDFSKKITSSLIKYRNVRINNIGLFSLGNEDNIIFHQDISTNFDLNSYGFESFKIQRKNIRKKIIDFSKSNNSKKYSFKAVAVLLPLILISLTNIVLDTSVDNFNIQKSGLIFFNKNITPNLDLPKKAIIKKIDKNKAVVDPKIIQYHLIAGAFVEESNAKKFNNSLINLNFDSKILVSDNGFYRVSYFSFNTKEEALIELEKIKRNNKSAWILTN